MATRSLETNYLVVGAGAMGMAFTDALVDHAERGLERMAELAREPLPVAGRA